MQKQNNSYEAKILRLCQSTGSSWLSEEYLLKYISFSNLEKKIKEGSIVKGYKNDSPFYTLSSIYSMEKKTVKDILRLKYSTPKILYNDIFIDKIIDKLERKLNVKLHKNQREAVKISVKTSFLVLTGGPGTGKTFTLNFIKEVHKELFKNHCILFAAPSGKAAKRITESIGEPADTIHKLLDITPEKLTPTPLSKNCTLLVCDEISLLDLEIFQILLSAISNGTKVILVGDPDQLPSVNHGAVLRDLISSNVMDVCKLTATFRQSGDSTLLENIYKIKDGKSDLRAGSDFRLATVPREYSGEEIFLWLYMKQAEKFGKENVLGLTPFRNHGKVNANNMNYLIQKVINPIGPSVELGNISYKIGDPVIQLKNNKFFSNGEIGHVKEITSNTMSVIYPGQDQLAYYNASAAEDISLAYAMTIHKAQGSESPAVVTALLEEHSSMAIRNILYTAITRAKENCDLLYDKKTLIHAIQNEGNQKRVTMLSELLRYGIQQLEMKY